MLHTAPVEAILLNEMGQFGLVREEEGEVGGEDAVFDVAEDLSVLLRVEFLEDVVILILEDVDGHVEVVVLHGGGGVDGG